ncbi:MAG: DUF4956 domain-containing protein [Lachnospiraceae bacterium]|nr:DUF4956 domain-containing protein [Lachnospiraceae bacterium]
MSFSDLFSEFFMQGFSGRDVGTKEIIITLIITCVLSLYIFFVYRAVTRKTFYSKNFNISLACVAIITTAIILTIQSSLVVSLGMVGALSIVRFRTAVKEPMDLAFLFWAISIGIMCGAGMTEIAVLSSLVITIMIVLLELIPIARCPMILVVNADFSEEIDNRIEEAVKKNCKFFRVKSRNISNGREDLVYEVRCKDEKALARDVAAVEGVTSSSVLRHDGEVTL